tara:strand:+ start:316 stop:633 length:318 start_codon:yes stop_codon:yes gene_type:complete
MSSLDKNLVYILSNISAQSCASTPPAPALIVITAFKSSYSPKYKASFSISSILFSIPFNSVEYSSSSISSSSVSFTSSSNSVISFSKALRDEINFSITEASIDTF